MRKLEREKIGKAYSPPAAPSSVPFSSPVEAHAIEIIFSEPIASASPPNSAAQVAELMFARSWAPKHGQYG
jgi:hypothetical protein